MDIKAPPSDCLSAGIRTDYGVNTVETSLEYTAGTRIGNSIIKPVWYSYILS